jgi:hypothetical protein
MEEANSLVNLGADDVFDRARLSQDKPKRAMLNFRIFLGTFFESTGRVLFKYLNLI